MFQDVGRYPAYKELYAEYSWTGRKAHSDRGSKCRAIKLLIFFCQMRKLKPYVALGVLISQFLFQIYSQPFYFVKPASIQYFV